MDRKSSLTLVEAQKRASIFLEENGFDGQLARHYWLLLFDWTLTDYIMQLRQPISQEQASIFQAALDRIIHHEPIQYITGYAEFMGERFEVTQDTLIPREDTAGLVELANIYLETNHSAKVLDIGTGTGIIPIMIAKTYPEAIILACDISQAALNVARTNSDSHQVHIDLIESDLFANINSAMTFDLIVSNPPYISEEEIEDMDESVKRFEPNSALFAENKGLAIYQRIAKECQPFIHDKTLIILEVGFRQADAVKNLFLKEFPNAFITINQDLNLHNRYVNIQL